MPYGGVINAGHRSASSVETMRAPSRRRPHIRRQSVEEGADLESIADTVRYVGSPEHKSYLSPAGTPQLRADASPCPKDLATLETLTGWLKEAIRLGNVGAPWEGGYPRYAWIDSNGTCFEARLVNQGNGEYKGYPLRGDERPDWIRQ